MFTQSKIKKAILSLISERIKSAEEKFIAGKESIAEQLKNDIESANEVAKKNEEELTNTLVKEVLSEIIK